MTPFVRGALTRARQSGARIVFVTCDPATELQTFVDLTIAPGVGAEVIAGSTRLKAATATKIVLNTISTAAMVKTGKVYGNLMVDVQTGSEKLKDRARRIVNIVTGLEYLDADKLLKKAHWNVKAAIVMQKTGLAYSQAVARLRQSSDSVRDAIGEDAEARLRALYRTRTDGTYCVRTIAPRGYAIPMDGPVARAALAALARDPLIPRIVREPDPNWGYTSLDGCRDEEMLHALDQLVSERLGVARNPPDRGRRHGALRPQPCRGGEPGQPTCDQHADDQQVRGEQQVDRAADHLDVAEHLDQGAGGGDAIGVEPHRGQEPETERGDRQRGRRDEGDQEQQAPSAYPADDIAPKQGLDEQRGEQRPEQRPRRE